MTTAARVPVTREEELEGDEALATLRHAGRKRLLLDAVDRFRAADGFSHSRALAFQITLTLLPALIAVVGLAAALGRRIVHRRRPRDHPARSRPAPSGTSSPTRSSRARTRRARSPARSRWPAAASRRRSPARPRWRRSSAARTASTAPRATAPSCASTSTARCSRRRPACWPVLSGAVLVGGSAIRDSVEFGETSQRRLGDRPLAARLALAVASIALLFEHAPRRRQPEFTWLAFGAATSDAAVARVHGRLRPLPRAHRRASARPTVRSREPSACCCGPSSARSRCSSASRSPRSSKRCGRGRRGLAWSNPTTSRRDGRARAHESRYGGRPTPPRPLDGRPQPCFRR